MVTCLWYRRETRILIVVGVSLRRWVLPGTVDRMVARHNIRV